MLALALQADPAPVHVELVDAGDARLRGAVVGRLLEEGHVLRAQSTAGVIEVRVTTLRNSVLIEARRDRVHARAEIDRGPDDLVRLEASQRAAALVRELATAGAAERDETPRVHLEVVGATLDDAELESAIAPLFDRGLALVGAPELARWQLCVWRREHGFVALAQADGPCDATGPTAVGVPLDQAIAGAADAIVVGEDQRTSDELDRLAATVAEPIPAAVVRRIPEPSTSSVPEPRRRGPHPWFVAAVDGGIEGRMRATEGLAIAGLAAGAGRWGAAIRAELVPSRAPSLRVLDAFVGLGPSITGRAGRRLEGSIAAMVGPVVHRHRFADAAVGHRVDAQFVVPMTGAVRWPSGLGIHLGLWVGAALHALEHVVDDRVVWHRSAWRVGASFGISYRWERRGHR